MDAFQDRRVTGIPSFLIDLFLDRKEKKKASQELMGMYQGASPEQQAQAKSLESIDPRQAFNYMLNEKSPETVQLRESRRLSNEADQLTVNDAQRKSDLLSRLDGLINGGASASPRGQAEIDQVYRQLAPTTALNRDMSMRPQPVGSPWRGDDGYMYIAVFDPKSGQNSVQRLGDQKADPRYSFSEAGGALLRTSPTDPNPAMVVDPTTLGAGEGQKSISSEDVKAMYDANQTILNSVDEEKRVMRDIDAAMNHKGFDDYYGWSSLNPLNKLPGSDRTDFAPYVRQFEGQAFMQAYQSLKGGGQITEIESQKAEQAITRIQDPMQSDESARKAWQDLKEVIEAGYERQRRRATTSAVNGSATKKYVPGKGIVDK